MSLADVADLTTTDGWPLCIHCSDALVPGDPHTDCEADVPLYLLDVTYTEPGHLFDVPMRTRVCVEAPDDQHAEAAALRMVADRGVTPGRVYGL